MGIQLFDIIPKKEIHMEELAGRTVAVDAMNILYQFLSIIRQRDGTPLMDSKGHITSHLSGVFYRGSNFLNADIKPVFIFDGKPPALKHKTILQRTERRDDARKKWKVALKKGNIAEARKFAMASTKFDRTMIPEVQDLLTAMGIPYIQAPSEGESQASYLVTKGDAYAVVTQDADALLYGATKVVRNLSITGRRKLPGREDYVYINPELITLEDVLKTHDINLTQLILAGILIGNDYEPGIKGVGPKTALKLVKKHTTLKKLISSDEVGQKLKALDVDLTQVENLFKKPEVTKKYKLSWDKPNTEKIKEILCEQHDFSHDRVDGTIDKLEKKAKEGMQTKLENFF